MRLHSNINVAGSANANIFHWTIIGCNLWLVTLFFFQHSYLWQKRDKQKCSKNFKPYFCPFMPHLYVDCIKFAQNEYLLLLFIKFSIITCIDRRILEGLINPILVIRSSWNFDDFFPITIQYYFSTMSWGRFYYSYFKDVKPREKVYDTKF